MPIISIFLFAISALLLLIYLLRTGNNVLDIRNIISQHFDIIKIDIFTLIVFIVVPITISIGCMLVKTIDEKILDTINIALPIYIGLQFSVIGVICSLNNGNADYEKIKEQTFNEVMFESIISIITLIISIVLTCVDITTIGQTVSYIISFSVYYLLFNVILNTFIVFKRLKFLFDER